MIRIDPLILITFPLAGALFFLLFAAVFYDIVVFRQRKRNKSKIIYHCTHCGYIYTEIRRIPLARCPECETRNPPFKN
ncbi:MAG: hypothetical protein WC959_05025 [Kiritimatiellales bacterium]